MQARSSVGERFPDTEEAVGSIPSAPTTITRPLEGLHTRMSEKTHTPIEVLRHSAAHLLAHAVLDLYPETKTGIGPAVETGFYYDFLRDTPFTPEDLEKIEARMKEIARQDVPVERLVLAKDEAIRMFEEKGQPLKVELIREKVDARGVRLPAGPTSSTSAAAPTCPRPAPWPIQAAVGLRRLLEGRRARPPCCSASTARSFRRPRSWPSHLRILEEAKKRDHRRLGTSSTCSASTKSPGPGSSSGTPRARASGAVDRAATGASATGGRLRDPLYPPHRAGRASGRPRATSASTRTPCTRRWTSTSRSTTSSR